jgi:hypothetical protein
MAAGYLQHLAGDRVQVLSAGSQPARQVNPVAVEAMAEEGIDIAANQPKILTEAVQDSDVVITMGCGDECPYFPGTRYEDWQLEDPPAKASTRSAGSATRSGPGSRCCSKTSCPRGDFSCASGVQALLGLRADGAVSPRKDPAEDAQSRPLTPAVTCAATARNAHRFQQPARGGSDRVQRHHPESHSSHHVAPLVPARALMRNTTLPHGPDDVTGAQ